MHRRSSGGRGVTRYISPTPRSARAPHRSGDLSRDSLRSAPVSVLDPGSERCHGRCRAASTGPGDEARADGSGPSNESSVESSCWLFPAPGRPSKMPARDPCDRDRTLRFPSRTGRIWPALSACQPVPGRVPGSGFLPTHPLARRRGIRRGRQALLDPLAHGRREKAIVEPGGAERSERACHDVDAIFECRSPPARRRCDRAVARHRCCVGASASDTPRRRSAKPSLRAQSTSASSSACASHPSSALPSARAIAGRQPARALRTRARIDAASGKSAQHGVGRQRPLSAAQRFQSCLRR